MTSAALRRGSKERCEEAEERREGPEERVMAGRPAVSSSVLGVKKKGQIR